MTALEQKLIVMLADVSGSAQLFKSLDDQDAARAIKACLHCISDSIAAHQGRLIQISGDEVLAVFGTPESACLSAIAMQQAIGLLPPYAGLKMAIRVGLHIGLCSESGDQLSGEPLTTTARIAAIAGSDQILISTTLRAALTPPVAFVMATHVDEFKIREQGLFVDVCELIWRITGADAETQQSAPARPPPAIQLHIRHHGKGRILNDRLPSVSFGRDLSNDFVIDDRKASRRHASIEKRGADYFLVDSSSNGSFVCFTGRQELMLLRQELRLEGSGRICFGTSGNDPAADCANFECR